MFKTQCMQTWTKQTKHTWKLTSWKERIEQLMIAVISTSVWSHSPFEDSKPLKDYQNFNMNCIIKKKLLPKTNWVLKIVKIIIIGVVVAVVGGRCCCCFSFPGLPWTQRKGSTRQKPKPTSRCTPQGHGLKLISICLLYKLKTDLKLS